jgi:hypothetical protein
MNPLPPTAIEKMIIDIYDKGDETAFEIADSLELEPSIVYSITNRWMIGMITYKPIKETTMAKNTEKNKTERDKLLKALREGKAEYSIDMDRVRGLLGELEQGEALICQKIGAGTDVVLRLGDVSYT